MAWTFTERAGSGKFRFSDDGSARGTISLVATLSDVSTDDAPAKRPTGTSADLLTALKANFPIGGVPSKPSTFDDWCTTWGDEFRITGYAGAVPTNSRGTVWYVDVELIYCGATVPLQGASLESVPFRKDVDITVTAVSRSAPTFVDWGATAPNYGDADWSSPGASLEITGTRVDVNGNPIPRMVPGNRFVIQILSKYDPSIARAEDITKRIGFRNSAAEFGCARGLVLFEGMDCAQVGHGFGRYTLKFYMDIHAHLQQEAATTVAGAPLGTGTTTTIGSAIQVGHTRAVWRQPYGLTSHENSWELVDILNYFDTAYGYFQTKAALASYINSRMNNVD